MTVSARKIAAFAKLVAGLADVPNLASSTLLKQWFDSSPEELRVAVNGLIDDLISTAAGASGTEQIGSAVISGVAGATAYAQLVDLKNQLTSAVMGSLTTETKLALTQKIGIINGNFGVWQEGTSFTGGYTADMWFFSRSGLSTTTITRDTNVPNAKSKYSLKTVGAYAIAEFQDISYTVESIDASKFSGQKATISFQHAETVSAGTVTATVFYIYPSAADNYATNEVVASSTITVSSVYALHSFTTTFPANSPVSGYPISNGIRIIIRYTQSVAVGTLTTYLSQVMLNSDAALLFQPKKYSEELEDCKRYFQIISQETANARIGHGHGITTTQADVIVPLQKEMRIIPTVSVSSITAFQVSDGAASTVCTNVTKNAGVSSSKIVVISGNVASGLTQFRPYFIEFATVGSVKFDARI